MARARIAGEKAERIAVREMRLLQRHCRAFRIGDALVDGERRVFAGACELDRALDRQLPRMVQVKIRYFASQQPFVCQAREFVARSEFRDRQRGIRRRAHGFERKIRRARMAAPLTDVNRNAHAFVAIVFDGLDFALAHRDGLAQALRHFGFAGGSAVLARILEHIGDDCLEARRVVGELDGRRARLNGGGHRRSFPKSRYHTSMNSVIDDRDRA